MLQFPSEVKEAKALHIYKPNQPTHIGKWVDPNWATFKRNKDLAWRYWENIDPDRDFEVVKTPPKEYGGEWRVYFKIRHIEHKTAKLSIISPLAKCRRVRLGLGNWSGNPNNKNMTGKARQCLKASLHKAEVTCELTRHGWDPYLTTNDNCNGPFMAFLEFRRKCQRWVAWWICKFNTNTMYVDAVRVSLTGDKRAMILSEESGAIKNIKRQLMNKKITPEEHDKQVGEAQDEKARQLKALEASITDDEMADSYVELKMHQTYPYHLDKVDPNQDVRNPDGTYTERTWRSGGGAAPGSGSGAGEVKKVPKPGTEHVPFKKGVFRKPGAWELKQFEKEPYMPPSAHCQVAWDSKEKLMYDPPKLFIIADMGKTSTAAAAASSSGGEILDEKALEERRLKDEAAAQQTNIVNSFNRPIPDGSILSIEFELGIYLAVQDKSGISDRWAATWFLKPPPKEELERQKEWRDGNSAGAKPKGRDITKYESVPGAEAYNADDYGKVIDEEMTDDTLKAMSESIEMEIKRREQLLKEGKSKPAATPTPTPEGPTGAGSAAVPVAPARKALETIPEKSAPADPPEYGMSQDGDQSDALVALAKETEEKAQARNEVLRRTSNRRGRSRSKEPEMQPPAPVPRLSLGRNKRKPNPED